MTQVSAEQLTELLSQTVTQRDQLTAALSEVCQQRDHLLADIRAISLTDPRCGIRMQEISLLAVRRVESQKFNSLAAYRNAGAKKVAA